MLCQHLPPPPDNLNVIPPPPDGKSTQRERLAKHSADPTCASCHKLMDPLGLAFESYDGIGRYRTMDVGKPLDTAGTLTGAEPEGATYKNGSELMKLLAESPTVSTCFVKTAFRYAYGREPEAGDACTVDRLAAQFATSGGNIMDLAVAMTTDDSFIGAGRADALTRGEVSPMHIIGRRNFLAGLGLGAGSPPAGIVLQDHGPRGHGGRTGQAADPVHLGQRFPRALLQLRQPG